MNHGIVNVSHAQIVRLHWPVNVLQAVTKNHTVPIVLVNYLPKDVHHARNQLPVSFNSLSLSPKFSNLRHIFSDFIFFKFLVGIGGTRFISFEDRHWHNDCFICASCKTSLVGRGFITDEADIICPECAKQRLS